MELKDKIIQLRSEDKSYREITEILNCSKGIISYYCGVDQKEKSNDRRRKYKSTMLGIFKSKKDNFSFVVGNRQRKGKRKSLTFSSHEFYDKLTSNPVCYLTGRKIDLSQPKTYQCDHIIPVTQGGDCSLDNLGLTCRNANIAKAHMMKDEFIQLCKEVLTHNGYTVTNNQTIT